MKIFCRGGAVALAFAAATPASAAPFYTITDLGVLNSPNPRSSAIGVTPDAVVALNTREGSQPQAAIWTNGTLTKLESFGGSASVDDISDNGVAVGQIIRPNNQVSYALWDQGTTTELSDIIALGVNSGKQVVGYTTYVTPQGGLGFKARILTNGAVTELGTLGGTNSYGFRINDAGWATGRADTANGEGHAFLWNGQTMTDLGTLGGGFATGYDINELGMVTGESRTSDGRFRGFFHDGSQMFEIGTLGTTSSMGLAVNEQGYVVGIAGSGADARALIYRNGITRDLNDFIDPASGWVLNRASDITINGYVVGRGTFQGMERAFLLAGPGGRIGPFPDLGAVPEPATWAMMVIGFGFAGAGVRRRVRLAVA